MTQYLDKQRWRALLFASLKAVPSVTLLMGILLAGTAAGQYRFTNIGDNSGSYRYFRGGPINNNGEIAIRTETPDGNALFQIWRDGSLSPVYDLQNLPFTTSSTTGPADINDAGAILFWAYTRGTNGTTEYLYVGDGGPLTTVAVGDAPDQLLVPSELNNFGQVTYEAGGSDGGGNYLFTGVGDPPIQLIHSDEGFCCIGRSGQNDRGEVAFVGADGGSSYLFFKEPGQPRTILLVDAIKVNNAPLNNLGQVLVHRYSEGSGTSLDLSIVSFDGVVPVADTTGPFFYFHDLQINDHGHVAFEALLGGHVPYSSGIFTGPDATANAVIVEGDTLFGAEVTSAGLGGLNNRGEISFFYRLDNGVHGVALASPVPEPDFNDDGLIDCVDVDSLVAEIVAGTDNSLFDLTGDGFVDTADLDEWRVQGGAANLPSGNPYLVGDATLDGIVDGLDFIEWNNHKFTVTAAWCSGDLNADGLIDGLDFVLWNDNKYTSADGDVVAVPEPQILLWSMVALLAIGNWRIRSEGQQP